MYLMWRETIWCTEATYITQHLNLGRNVIEIQVHGTSEQAGSSCNATDIFGTESFRIYIGTSEYLDLRLSLFLFNYLQGNARLIIGHTY
jgi:hypothetical protein